MKEYQNDKHYHWLEENKDFDWKAYENTKNNIRKEIKELKENSKKIAQDSLDLINNNGLEIDDFAQGANGIGGFFKKIIEYNRNEKYNLPFYKILIEIYEKQNDTIKLTELKRKLLRLFPYYEN